MKKLKGLKRQLELPTRNHILIWKLAKRITALEQDKQMTNESKLELPEGYEVIDNALVHPDGSVIAISRSQKITTIQNPIITEMFKKKLDAIDSRALAIWLQRTTNQ